MSDSTEIIRWGALEIGQKTAQIVVFTCIIAFVGLLIVAPSESDQALPTPTSVSAQLLREQEPVLTASPTLSQATPPSQTPTGSPAPPPSKTPTNLASTLEPTVTPAPRVPRIGIVAGHWWLDEDGQQTLDVGSVCNEGSSYELREVDVNLEVAQRVVFELLRAGYRAELLQEWDDLLDGYQADVLLSIHADACLYPEASGFKVAHVADSHVPEVEDRLVACIVERYGARTRLTFHEGSITSDMTRYHTFYKIHPNTPGAIIEVGFMLADRTVLTQRPDLVAQGVIDGILCFLEGEGKALE